MKIAIRNKEPIIQKISQTARAAVLQEPGKFILKDIRLREPQGNEVCIKLRGCGLCASSLPLWEGREWFDYPAAAGSPGHEGWGVIYQIGKQVTSFKEGDAVAFISSNAFAEYDYAPATQVVKLPHSLSEMAFPGEPLGCAANIYNRSTIQAGQTVAIIGCGFLGALLIQLAKAKGAFVIAISRRASSRTMAYKYGADVTLPMDDHYQIIEQVKEITDGVFCDRVIECTGKEWPLNLAGELCKERGRLIIAGYHQDGMRQVNIQLWNWKGLDVINAHERDPECYTNGIKQAINYTVDGMVDLSGLLTHSFPLEEINSAFRMQENAPEGFIKAYIQFR